MDWFEKRAREIQSKDLEGFRKEQLEKEEAYAREILDSEYETTHDYENMVTRKAIGRALVILLCFIGVLIWWLI